MFNENLAETTLDRISLGQMFVVQKVSGAGMPPEWERWLEEIGFVAGEHVRLMARGFPGGDPMVVRIGQSTFALRRAEAACVHVVPDNAPETVTPAARIALEGARA